MKEIDGIDIGWGGSQRWATARMFSIDEGTHLDVASGYGTFLAQLGWRFPNTKLFGLNIDYTGAHASIHEVLGEAGVNIRALSLADTSDFGILRLIVNNNDKAIAALKEHGFTVGKTNVGAVEVEDKPGGLNHILEVLSKASLNVEYMYAFVQHSGEDAVIIFRFDDIDGAIKVLKENKIKVMEGETVYTL